MHCKRSLFTVNSKKEKNKKQKPKKTTPHFISVEADKLTYDMMIIVGASVNSEQNVIKISDDHCCD